MRMKVLGKCLLLSLVMMLFPVVSGVLAVVSGLVPPRQYWLQGAFMLLSLLVPAGLVIARKFDVKQLGLHAPTRDSVKLVLYFIPLLLAKAAYFPFASRFSFAEILALVFFTISIGLAEEIYFRGVILSWLKGIFTTKQAICLSAVFFGIVHASQAFSGEGFVMVSLAVVNAVLFGLLAAILLTLTGSLFPVIIWHSLYNFTNWLTSPPANVEVILIVFETLVMISYGVYLWSKLPAKERGAALAESERS